MARFTICIVLALAEFTIGLNLILRGHNLVIGILVMLLMFPTAEIHDRLARRAKQFYGR